MPKLPLRAALAVPALLLATTALAETAPQGSYECWYFSTPRLLYNFSLNGKGYVDAEGHQGAVTEADGRMKFSGGNLDGQIAVYKPGNPPTISFRNERDEESFFCQLAQ